VPRRRKFTEGISQQRRGPTFLQRVLRRCAHGPPLLKAFAAEHRSALRRAERNCSFLSALRAGCLGFSSLECIGTRTRTLRAFGFAVLAPLGLVFEALVGEKHLFAGGEDKFLIAFRTLQDLIVIFHTPLRGSKLVRAHGTPGHIRYSRDTPGKNVGPNSDWPKVLWKIPGRRACLGEVSPTPAAAFCGDACAIALVLRVAFLQASCNNCAS
jgi:hypothetical protein